MTRIRKLLPIGALAVALAVPAFLAGNASAGTGTPANQPAAAPANQPAAAPAVAAASGEHTVTFVNRTNETIWIGSAVNADRSVNLTRLPTLAPGQSATVTIPEKSDPYHWRGKFFARQRCTGTSGSNFHCQVGDCGVYADHCTTGEQPASLAEFNFDPADSLAPWYNVSYVNAFSLPITISADNAPAPPPGGGSCETVGCSQDLLPYCPPANVTYDAAGKRLLCTSPNRDAKTPYSDALGSRCPKAYSWSKHDTEYGNQVMRQCANCSGFTVTFHPTSGGTNTRTGEIKGVGGKCVDVQEAKTENGTQIQLYRCNGTDAQKWTIATDGSVRALGKCLDVDGGKTGNGTKVQLWECNGSAAQKWVYSSGQDIVNPQANKCLDAKDMKSDDGTPLHIWECGGTANQKWTIPN